MVIDAFSSNSRLQQGPVNAARPVAAASTPCYGTDQLNRAASPSTEIAYSAAVAGCPIEQAITHLGGRAHAHAPKPKAIGDAELRTAIADICDRAAHVSSEADLKSLGEEAATLLDRVNATPRGKLSEAARASAARAIMPLAQAGEFEGLLTQAQHVMGSYFSSAAEKREAARFMHEHGSEIHTQIKSLDVEPSVLEELETQFSRVAMMMQLIMQQMLEWEEGRRRHDEEFKAELREDAANDERRIGQRRSVEASDLRVRDAAQTERRSASA